MVVGDTCQTGVTHFFLIEMGVVVKPGTVLAQAPDGKWLLFSAPLSVLCARTHADVLPVMAKVQKAIGEGKFTAGFMAYEAATVFDSALETYPPDGFPLVWFGIYDKPEHLHSLPPPAAPFTEKLDWQPDTAREEYADAIRRIREWIRAGDTYQVNYTMRLRSQFEGDPYALFVRLCKAQAGQYAVFGDLGDWAVCSASPELFFATQGKTIISRPMKGTSKRGLTTEQDADIACELAVCEKNRAENVMIVDMIRNDLGRIADPDTIQPESLFAVERYNTLFQMVSTVRAETSASFSDIVRALFPCASITGAPKVRTMQLIRELEKSPRHFYTGMAGYCQPDGVSRFNVMIRTVTVEKQSGIAEYGVGGGIVWDSVEEKEYAECLTKAAVLTHVQPAFEIVETLRYDPDTGFAYLAEHGARASASAEYFGYPFDFAQMERVLEAAVRGKVAAQRVRWLLGADGAMRVESVDLLPLPEKPVGVGRVGSCRSNDVFLYHKTTHREAYKAALAAFPECGDVILVNQNGEVTESCLANVVVERDGQKYTPPVSCGLLNGTMRRALIATGALQEARITRDELLHCDRLWLINSVRGWMEVPRERLRGG